MLMKVSPDGTVPVASAVEIGVSTCRPDAETLPFLVPTNIMDLTVVWRKQM